jgi:hypothetical protein
MSSSRAVVKKPQTTVRSQKRVASLTAEYGLRTLTSLSEWEPSYLMDCDEKLSSTAKAVSELVAMIYGSSVW